jgi:hypothetical protein
MSHLGLSILRFCRYASAMIRGSKSGSWVVGTWLIVVFGILGAGCASTKIDWNSRI